MTRKVLVREALTLAAVIAILYITPAIFDNPAPALWIVVLVAVAWAVIRFLMIRFVEGRHRTPTS